MARGATALNSSLSNFYSAKHILMPQVKTLNKKCKYVIVALVTPGVAVDSLGQRKIV